MIKIENVSVSGWEQAIRGMRNPLQSHAKSDSYKTFIADEETMEEADYQFFVDEADHDLMFRLAKAGPEHAKYRRMIVVYADITAPSYWVSELDTYKVGTTRNSCSLQHKGASKPFTIRDFSVDEKIYEILDPIKNKLEHKLIYAECADDNYKIYEVGDRKYKVFKNGRVFSCEYVREHKADNRTRHFEERECKVSQTPSGYYELNVGGREYTERWLLHRLVATVWLSDSYFPGAVVNHKDGNKGNNCVDNLEWVTHQRNDKHKFEIGLGGRTLHTDYLAWKNSNKVGRTERNIIVKEYESGMKQSHIAKTHGISQAQVSAIIRKDFCKNDSLFCYAEVWENLISTLNDQQELYNDTKDYNYFCSMRCLIPMGYNYRFTWCANYEVLSAVYRQRKNHKLPEWNQFCDWIETLPYSELITLKEPDTTA